MLFPRRVGARTYWHHLTSAELLVLEFGFQLAAMFDFLSRDA
tara:strand:+ start:331 stop:456 length:126 start_codon:yes stop_codon:yes gene_type:complete